MIEKKTRAVIWDLDGTLIDSAEYHWEAWQEVMAAEKFTISYEEYVADFGKRNDEILRGRLGEHLTEDYIARVSLAKEEAYRALVRTRGLDLLPGAARWLARLQEDGWMQALGTSAPRGNIDAVFDALDIARFFNAVMSADQVERGKPFPDVFLAAARKLEVAPSDCIVVEDAPAGIEAARRAGMVALAVRSTHPDLTGDYTVESLDLLPEVFFDQVFTAQ
ncbi:MAG: HAD family hydrolase [Blastocatellales bacterium]